MKEINLTSKEKEQLRKLQRQTKDKRVYRKIAVIMGLDNGLNYALLSKILFLDEITIRRYQHEYLSNDLDNYIRNKYKGYWGKLDSHQIARLRKELNDNLYQTTNSITAWIEKEFRIRYNPQGLVHLLHKMGFAYKKTKLIPGKTDEKAQREFLEKFKELQENLKENEVIYFGDGVHPQHNTKLANGWIEKGKERLIKSNTGRTRINLNGVLNPATKEVIIREDKTINAESTIELFKEVEEKNQTKEKIFIIVDNARYYKNKMVTEYLETSKIEIIFLPPYSPNLNLIERLWKFMKRKVINNLYYEKSSVFRQTLLDFFDNIDQYKEELESLLTCNFHIFQTE